MKSNYRIIIAAVLALISGAGLLHTHRKSIETPRFDGDSYHYYRDALALQARFFHSEVAVTDWVIAAFEKHTNRAEVIRKFPDVRFCDRILFSAANAVALEFSDTHPSGIAHLALGWVVGALFLALYFILAEVRPYLILLAIPVLLFSFDPLFLANLKTESGLAFFVVLIPWLCWRAFQAKTKSIFIPMLLLFAASLFKTTLIPFSAVAAFAIGISYAKSRLPDVRRRLAVFLAGVAIALLLITGSVLARNAIISSYHLAPNCAKTNAGYGLWVGSFPTTWTGSYFGRTSTGTAEAQKNPEFVRQSKLYGNYFVPISYVFGEVIKNHLLDPVDSLRRLTFRFSHLFGYQGLDTPWKIVALVLLLAAVISCFVSRDCGIWPFLLVAFGIVGMHALSRTRERDYAQMIGINLVLFGLGADWIIGLISGLITKKRLPHIHDVAPVFRGLVCCLALLPFGLGAVFPETQNNTRGKPTWQGTSIVRQSSPKTFHISTLLHIKGGAFQFVGINTGSGERSYQQLDALGNTSIEFEISATSVPNGIVTIGVEHWSLTGRTNHFERSIEVNK